MKSPSPPLLTEELPLRAEQDELQAAAQSRVFNPGEIQQLLGKLIAARAVISLYPEKPGIIARLPVLGIDGHQLILGLPEEGDRGPVFDARQLLCVGLLDRVKLQFDVGYPRLVDWQHQPALAVTSPANILRLQRRSSYRLTVPLTQPLSCYIPQRHDDEIEVSVIDLSVGGMGVLAFIPGMRFGPGDHYHGVRIELPGMASVGVDILVRSRLEIVLRNGIRTVRTGLEFTRLPVHDQHQIQQYIGKTELLSHP
ncbi:flagellar brake protein [Chitinimonas naiadis]